MNFDNYSACSPLHSVVVPSPLCLLFILFKLFSTTNNHKKSLSLVLPQQCPPPAAPNIECLNLLPPPGCNFFALPSTMSITCSTRNTIPFFYVNKKSISKDRLALCSCTVTYSISLFLSMLQCDPRLKKFSNCYIPL